MLLIRTALVILITNSSGTAMDSFPLTQLDIACVDDYDSSKANISLDLPCEMSDYKNLLTTSHFCDLLTSYIVPNITSEMENSRIQNYRTTEWYKDMFDTYVRNVSYITVFPDDRYRFVKVDEIQVMRNYTDRFLLQSYIGLNVVTSQRFVMKVKYCGSKTSNGSTLMMAYSTIRLPGTTEGFYAKKANRAIRESFLIYADGMLEHCTRRDTPFPVSNVLISNATSPILLDSRIVPKRPLRIQYDDYTGNPLSMESVLRQVAYKSIWTESHNASKVTSVVAETSSRTEIFYLLFGTLMTLSILTMSVYCYYRTINHRFSSGVEEPTASASYNSDPEPVPKDNREDSNTSEMILATPKEFTEQ